MLPETKYEKFLNQMQPGDIWKYCDTALKPAYTEFFLICEKIKIQFMNGNAEFWKSNTHHLGVKCFSFSKKQILYITPGIEVLYIYESLTESSRYFIDFNRKLTTFDKLEPV